MSDFDINKMDFKQLRNEVQLLRDELAIMKRKYEDIIYNLDTDNFSSRFVKEQGDMRTAIEVTAKGIETKVSNEEFQSTQKQTAELISSEVKKLSDADGELSTKISQTAADIRAEVKKVEEDTKNGIEKTLESYTTLEVTEEKISLSAVNTTNYVTDLLEEEYVTKANFELRYDGLYTEVVDLQDTADGLKNSVSSVAQTANEISMQVSRIDNGEFIGGTLFTQDANKFYFDGNQTIFTGCIWFTNNDKQKRFSISHDESNAYKPAIYLYNTDDGEPIVIGKTDDCVYLANENDTNNLVATRGWVLENAGVDGDIKVVAVFG